MKFSLILLALLCLGLAQESSPLQQKLEQDIASYEALREQRNVELAAIEETLGETVTVLNAQIAERDTIQTDLSDLKSQRYELETEIETLQGNLDALLGDVGALEEQIAKLKRDVEVILIKLYKQRNGSFAYVVGRASSFHELQVKTHYLTLLAEQDLTLIKELNETALSLAGKQQEQTEQLSSLTVKTTALSETEQALAGKQSELDTVIDDLESTQEGQLALKADIIRQQAEIEASISQTASRLEREKERLRQEASSKRQQAAEADTVEERDELIAEAELAEDRLAALGAPLPPLSSGYVYPIDNPTLISNYGQNGVSGVILSTDQAGAAVKSIQSGVVIDMSKLSANDGYIVTIQHSAELSSSYINLQAMPLIGIGDRISQGQVIGYLGGGTLLKANVLKLYTSVTSGGSSSKFINPAQLLGF